MILLMISYMHSGMEKFVEKTVNNSWKLIYVFFLNYVLFEHVFPFIGRKRSSIVYNILIAIPFFFIFLMLYSFGLYAWRLLGISVHIYTSLVTPDTELISEQMSFSVFSLCIMGLGRHIYGHWQLRLSAQKLRVEKQEAELNYLKSQTNPHFLFNTLNNIYSLARDKSDLAPESILRLSKILRFMLYETNGAHIAIEQELKVINDYIALERLRYDESLRINFNYDVEDMKQAVPPLLLVPLVENAFKHGVSETRGYPFIDIHLSVNNRKLLFLVKNSSEAVSSRIKENIGLTNLRRQLELLYTDFNLSVAQEQSSFTATLKINLSSHVQN
ncbi:MAG: sensor histidine kinase [Flavitalea sp.]